MKTILILSANPIGTDRLRLDKEVREIDAGLQRARHRNEFRLEQKWAVRAEDLRRALLDCEPNIVHFCGHGTGAAGILLEDEQGKAYPVSTEALSGLFELFAEPIECVVLNACYSETQARAIAQHIKYVIGMNQAIGDDAAIEFSTAFYDGLGAGKQVDFAYKLACSAIHLKGITGHLTPVLVDKSTPASENPPPAPSQPPEDEKMDTEELSSWLYDRLTNMLPGIFDEVVFKYRVPNGVIADGVAQSTKVKQLLQYAEEKEATLEVPKLRQLVEKATNRKFPN